MQRLDPIEIVPYRPGWPAAFEAQRQRVEPVIRPWLHGTVEHIGSTAVPGLAAKPIIDMLGCVDRYADGVPAGAALSRIGWVAAPEPDDEAGRKWSFCFPNTSMRTHHLHLFLADDPLVGQILAFRDHLRTHPGDATEYARAKSELAAADNRDRPRYRAGKAPCIAAILQRIAVAPRQSPGVG